ncbi:MAG: CvpA family protein [Pseudomonadota bacterium]
MEFTIADGAVAGVLLLSGVLAWSRGFVREALSIGGWILAAFAALYIAPWLDPLLREAPVIGGFLSTSCSLAKLAAFSVGFAGALIVISIFTPLLSNAVEDSVLGPLDKAAGFLFGVARGLVLVTVAYLLYLVIEVEPVAAIDNAVSIGLIDDAATALQASLPSTIPEWIMRPVNGLMAECGGVPLLSGEPATE